MQEVQLSINSPLSGVVLDLKDVPDAVFAQKMVGDGFAIDPTSNLVVSPVKGVVKQIHEKRHALTLETKEGLQLLIHVGIDTVMLNGQGLHPLVKAGQKVEIGTALLEFDMDYLALNSKGVITPVVILNSNSHAFTPNFSPGEMIQIGEKFFSLQLPQKNIDSKQSSTTSASKTVTINNPLGIHARPAAQMAKIVRKHEASASLFKNNQSADATSLIEVLSLEIKAGDQIEIRAHGPDAEQVIDQLGNYLQSLKEEIIRDQSAQVLSKKPDSSHHFFAQSVVDGIGLGKILQVERKLREVQATSAEAEIEKKDFQNKLHQLAFEIEEDLKLKKQNLSQAQYSILKSHLEILKDPALINETMRIIEKNLKASYAWQEAFKQMVQKISSLSNPLLAQRAHDIEDIGQRLLAKLLGEEHGQNSLPEIHAGTILIAHHLSPSQTAHLDKNKVAGLVTVEGGSTSHLVIIAKSLGIPTLIGANPNVLSIPNATEAIINSLEGVLKITPSNEEKEQALKKQQELKALEQKDLEMAKDLAFTKDNQFVEVTANISSFLEAQEAKRLGGDGVGLMRSEFLYFDRLTPPSFEEQKEIYQNIYQTFNPQNQEKTIIIRTLDIGGDKPLDYLPIEKEANPFLGMRGIRVSLNNLDLLTTQMEAILAAASGKKIGVMFPMVTFLDEFLMAKEILLKLKDKYSVSDLQIGVMIEVPSAALMAESFAPHVDFFSIGANDLAQYTLAIDRGHKALALRSDGLHPAVLKLIDMTCKASHKYQKWVGVCGGMASDLQAIPILIGLGVKELSVSMPMIGKIKNLIRRLDSKQCQELAIKALNAQSSEEVRRLS